MVGVVQMQDGYDKLMNTLPALLAQSANVATHISSRVNFSLDGSCTIGRGRFEGFVKAATPIIARRDAQQVRDGRGRVTEDKIFVPIIGRPAIGQPVAMDYSEGPETRADCVYSLFKERKLLDQMVDVFRQMVRYKDELHAIKASDGGIYAYKMPSRMVENLINTLESAFMVGWRPGEFRSVEAAIALKEALGLATKTMDSLFEGNGMRRLMPRAHEDLVFTDNPEAIWQEMEGEEDFSLSVEEIIDEALETGGSVAVAGGEVEEVSAAKFQSPPQERQQFSFDFG